MVYLIGDTRENVRDAWVGGDGLNQRTWGNQPVAFMGDGR